MRRLARAFTLAACATLFTFGPRAARAEDAPRYLLVHLDAVSAASFEKLLAAGRLPNLERIFADGVRLRGLTLFPASTPMVRTRIRSGASSAEPGPIGFGGFDRDRGRPIGDAHAFFATFGSVPRRARATFLYGVPGIEALASLGLQNLPELLRQYHVVEFFWTTTDAVGHLLGEEPHARSLERFDTALGAAWSRLDPDGLNVVVYGDHGMTFTDEPVGYEAILEAVAAGRLRHAAYPNLYLRDPSEAPGLAYALTRPGLMDFAFYRAGDGLVAGYLDGAFVTFAGDGEGIRYRSHEDPLGYAALGYAGEALTPQAWLDLTIDTRFPAAPAGVFLYLQHPAVGDLVAGINPPRSPVTSYTSVGSHAGLADTDLVVPVLVRGPDVGALAGRDPLWLHTVFDDLPELDFAAVPRRDLHTLEAWLRLDDLAVGARLRLSPAYRWRFAAEVTPERWQLWGERDVFATYLSRLWLGAGSTIADGSLRPFGRAEWELDLAEAHFSLAAEYGGGGWTVGLRVGVHLGDHLRLTWHGPTGVGLGWRW